MDFFDVIYARKSVRTYLNRSVPDDKLDAIVTAGTMAPCKSALRFTVISNKDMLDKFAEEGRLYLLASGIKPLEQAAANPNFKLFDGAPVMILISSPHANAKIAELINISSANCALENMLLATTALGLGGCYKVAPIYAFSRPELKAAVGLDLDDDVVGSLVLGYTDDTSPHPPRKPATNIRYRK